VGAHQGLARQHPAATRRAHRGQLRLHPPLRPLRPIRRPSRHLREQSHHHQLRGRRTPCRRTRPQHHARLWPRRRRRFHPQQLARQARAQPGRRLRQPQPARTAPLLALPRRPRRSPLQPGFRLLTQRGRSLHPHKNTPPPRLRRPRLPPANLRRSQLLRPRDARQPQPEARDKLGLRGRSRLDPREPPPHLLSHGLPPQSDQRNRLRKAHPRHPRAHRHREVAGGQQPHPRPQRRGSQRAHSPQLNPATPIQLHRKSLREPARQLPLRVRLQLRRSERHLRVDRSAPRHMGPRNHRPHPGQRSPEDRPAGLSTMGRGHRPQHGPHPSLPAPAQSLEHRLHRNPPRPHARPNHHGRHAT